MPYVLLPTSGQSLGVTRDPIRTNFQLIQTTFDANHVDFDAADPGTHKKVEFVAIVNNPAIAGGVVSVLYSTASKGLSFKTTTAGVNFNIVQDILPINLADGMSQLPGRLLIEWGSGSTDAAGVATIIFPSPFTHASATAPWSIQVTGISASITQSFTVTSATLLLFKVKCSASVITQFSWIAIGPLT